MYGNTKFEESEIAEILRIFELKNKRGMTERDWREFCMTLRNSTGFMPTIEHMTHLIMNFIPPEKVERKVEYGPDTIRG